MTVALCGFVASFKTKGNLTKHMKSKAHYKKCMELGIIPVPTVVDDSYIDEECLTRQVSSVADSTSRGNISHILHASHSSSVEY
jgi:hypothetical protein